MPEALLRLAQQQGLKQALANWQKQQPQQQQQQQPEEQQLSPQQQQMPGGQNGVRQAGVLVALEVDGPSHFAVVVEPAAKPAPDSHAPAVGDFDEQGSCSVSKSSGSSGSGRSGSGRSGSGSSSGSSSRVHRLGATVCRDWLLQQWGWRLLVVPAWEWE
jgi:hypothetical protein